MTNPVAPHDMSRANVQLLQQRLAEAEQQLAEHAITEHQLRRHILTIEQSLDALPDLVLIKGSQSRIVYANHAFREYYGMTLAQLRDLIDAPFNEPDFTQQYVKDDAFVFETGQTLEILQEPVTRHDGKVRNFHTVKSPIRDEHGEIIQTVGISRDITERHHTELSATLARHQLQGLIDSLDQFVWSLDLTTQQYVYVSASGAHMFGVPLDTLRADPLFWKTRIHPDDVPHVEASDPHVFSGQPATIEHRIIRTDGVTRWVVLDVKPVLDDTGQVVRLDGIVTDITDRKETELMLRESQSLLAKMTANAPGMLYQFTLTPDGSVQWPFVSKGCLDIYGVPPQTVQQQPMLLVDMTHPDDRPAFDRSVAESAEQLSEWTWEGRVVLSSGVIKWLQGVSRPERLSNGTVRWDGILMDITARKHAEAEAKRLQEALIRVQAATLAELSTPLIPISDQVVVMPLIGTLDTHRVQNVLETLLRGIEASRAHIAILDITGVPVVDTQVANTLLQAAQAVNLLGARVVLTGIRPEVAQTLVGLGIDFSTITTRSSLQSGIAYARQWM